MFGYEMQSFSSKKCIDQPKNTKKCVAVIILLFS